MLTILFRLSDSSGGFQPPPHQVFHNSRLLLREQVYQLTNKTLRLRTRIFKDCAAASKLIQHFVFFVCHNNGSYTLSLIYLYSFNEVRIFCIQLTDLLNRNIILLRSFYQLRLRSICLFQFIVIIVKDL